MNSDVRLAAAACVLRGDGDGSPRWQPGERLDQLWERRCDELSELGRGDRLAVDGPAATLSYAALDRRASQLARFLRRGGVGPGDRVALLLDQPADVYAGMLAVLKLRAAYVPLDRAFPPSRMTFIVADAAARMVLTCTSLAAEAAPLGSLASLIYLDEAEPRISAEPAVRLGLLPPDGVADELCYIIYTSGTTGRPKGVPITHASICNFVRVAAQTYGIAADDRVYQGMTTAFDFSVEEIWVPWLAGATLVPKPAGPNLVGRELHAFLALHHVTALCCVPTLLGTLEADLPALRFLLVSGESCPQDLVTRWHRPGRRFLNVYGPTEATVTATWTPVQPGSPVTIGVPLPTYSVVILDPDADRALPAGQPGEIGIAGIGLTSGYLNRPELTERAFVPDFLGIPGNPSGRIYRTGDLGLISEAGQVEHHGRIDSQVKISGYRIELGEIESVLRAVPGVSQAVVACHEVAVGTTELAAYYTQCRDAGPVDTAAAYELLRDRLPRYMVPAYLEQLAEIPSLVSGKADRASLPRPRGPRLPGGRPAHVRPAPGTEQVLAGLLAPVLGADRVSAVDHFFDDLGANSLLMARFNAAAREIEELPAISMREVYLHPTIRQLAAVLDQKASTAIGATAAEPEPVAGDRSPACPAAGSAAGQAVGAAGYLLCGLLQVLVFIGYAVLAALALDLGSRWAVSASGTAWLYVRAAAFGAGLLLAAGLLPIAVKWLLIGRWRPARIRVWSLRYLRFWVVKTLLIANPTARMCVGTPLYTLYLRALGARIGPGTLIMTKRLPVCTDLLTVGAGCVIRKDTYLNGYRAVAGVIETGAISLGDGAFVGEQSVLDIGTAIGAGAQLGHSSALHAGQQVPDGQCWHGSPAQPAPAGCDYLTVPAADCGRARRAGHCAVRLVMLLAVTAPLTAAAASLELAHPPLLSRLLPRRAFLTSLAFDRDVLGIAAVLVLGLVTAALLAAGLSARLLSRLLVPGRVYPLYGFGYAVQRTVARLTNIPLLVALFGDSSAVVGYLRLLGYRLRPVLQTGSNFGMAVKHEVPALTAVGTGTMASDGLSIMNAEFSSSSFRVLPAVIGARNFLGNKVAYPAGGRTGDDCLLATKVMVPVSGPDRQGVGLLGSPPFEIPRSVRRDRQFDALIAGDRRQRLLRAKNRHNAATVALHLLVRYCYVAGLVLVACCPFAAWGWPGWVATATSAVADLAFTIVFFVLVERAVTGFRPLQPRFCSVYDVAFWRHERYWKVPATAYVQMFNGTPVKSVIWRLLGVRVGRRVFDDGCGIAERSMVSLGSGCTLNAGSNLHCHSMEDGAFKSDLISIGAGCTIGTGAFVHYGVVVGEHAVLDADSFLMKGEHVPGQSRWRGNPATELLAAPATDLRK